LVAGDLTGFPFRPDVFDLIVSCDVVEHIADHIKAVHLVFISGLIVSFLSATISNLGKT
jgi:2-polyprenyl-3-methyl-5-hydroxy-6-metoxy-1,4-benzoquinol methylase